MKRRARPPVLPGLMLGIGFAGFFDGILLHQILQWHHMVTGREPTDSVGSFETNTLADGLFQLAIWVCVVTGVTLMFVSWRRGRVAPLGLTQIALYLIGFGLFNVMEGVVDHQILNVHHVRDDLGGPFSWDLGFLITNALILAAGFLLWRAGLGRDTASRPDPSADMRAERFPSPEIHA